MEYGPIALDFNTRRCFHNALADGQCSFFFRLVVLAFGVFAIASTCVGIRVLTLRTSLSIPQVLEIGRPDGCF